MIEGFGGVVLDDSPHFVRDAKIGYDTYKALCQWKKKKPLSRKAWHQSLREAEKKEQAQALERKRDAEVTAFMREVELYTKELAAYILDRGGLELKEAMESSWIFLQLWDHWSLYSSSPEAILEANRAVVDDYVKLRKASRKNSRGSLSRR